MFPLPLVLALGPACGGSSSETPFPVEPDFRREAKNAGPSRELIFSGAESDGGGGDVEGDEPPTPESGDAVQTWGGTKKPAPRTAPRPRPKPEAEPEELEPEGGPELELR
jgi:hypothetical protein